MTILKPKTLAAKLAEVGREVAYVQKTSQVSTPGQRWRYAPAEAVLAKVNEALFTRGIAVTMTTDTRIDMLPRDGRNNVVLATVTLRATFTDGETGETLSSEGVGSGCDTNDKAVMKAFTAAHKYLYAGVFCISWGDDPEATDEEGKPTAPKKEKPSARRKQALKPEAPAPSHPLLDKIAAAGSVEDLEALRPEVLELRTGAEPGVYLGLVDAFRARKDALQE